MNPILRTLGKFALGSALGFTSLLPAAPIPITFLDSFAENGPASSNPSAQESGGYIRLVTPPGPRYLEEGEFFRFIDLKTGALKSKLSEDAFGIGKVVTELPKGSDVFLFERRTIHHYEGNFFAKRQDGGYVVIGPPVGALLSELPSIATDIEAEGQTLYSANGVVFRPVNRLGRQLYEVLGKQP